MVKHCISLELGDGIFSAYVIERRSIEFINYRLNAINKVVSDIFGKFEFFDEISKYGFIRTFCTIFESYNPFDQFSGEAFF